MVLIETATLQRHRHRAQPGWRSSLTRQQVMEMCALQEMLLPSRSLSLLFSLFSAGINPDRSPPSRMLLGRLGEDGSACLYTSEETRRRRSPCALTAARRSDSDFSLFSPQTLFRVRPRPTSGQIVYKTRVKDL